MTNPHYSKITPAVELMKKSVKLLKASMLYIYIYLYIYICP